MDSNRLIEKLKKGSVKIKSRTNSGPVTVVCTLKRDLMDRQLSVSGRHIGNSFSKSLRKPYRYLDVWNTSTSSWDLIRWDRVLEVDDRKLKNGIEYIG